MSGVEIVLGVLLGLVVNETTDLSPWLGRLFVRWSARLRYGESELGATRQEELQALIDARPGKLFKLFTGVGFASSALLFRLRRLVRPETTITDAPVSDLSELGPRRVLALEDEPTTLIARYLFPTERYRGEWKRHWISPVKSASVILLYAVLGVWAVQLRIKPQYVDLFTIGICAVALVLLLWQVPRWYFDRFTLTNKRIMVVRGVVRRRVEMLPLLRVTDIRYVQSPLGRVLGYGTFENKSAGWRRPLRRLRDLPHPGELYLRIIEEMYEPLAVEARLGHDEDDEDGGLEVIPDQRRPEDDQIGALIRSIDALVEVLRLQAAAQRPADGATAQADEGLDRQERQTWLAPPST
ncbi:PH domain-containing protein [Actinoplanes sp. NPDC048796]|uniref:PH domain-containing protein n=1 Tax=unclassified Actinoplanes TaxID=2626549 RepID=UPI0033E1A432